jgi:hypothetical protein
MNALTARQLKNIIDSMDERQLDMVITISGEDDRLTAAEGTAFTQDGGLIICE